MSTAMPVHGDLRRLTEAKRKAGEAATFDDMLKVVLDELAHWPPGTTDGFRNQIADLLRTAADRERKLVI